MVVWVLTLVVFWVASIPLPSLLTGPDGQPGRGTIKEYGHAPFYQREIVAESVASSSVAHRGEEHNLTNRVAPGHQHHEPVDPQTDAGSRGHPLLQRLDEDFVVRLRFLLAGFRDLRTGTIQSPTPWCKGSQAL